MKTELMFELDKITRNTVRFMECSDCPIIGSLYIQKDHLMEADYDWDLTFPKKIKIILDI